MSIYRVLLVEDNICNQVLIKKFMKKLNIAFDLAENGQEALQYVSNVKYDAILMDIMMPVMDGIEATKRIRSIPGFSDLPIIGVSANSEKKWEAISAGMNTFIDKPLNLSKISQALEEFIHAENSLSI